MNQDHQPNLEPVGEVGAKRRELHWITVMRFFCAFIVLLYHFAPVKDKLYVGPLVNIAANGHQGVICFFILSGFILSYSYPNMSGKQSYGSYYWARFARIAPLALISFLPFLWITLRSSGSIGHAIITCGINLLGLGAWFAGPANIEILNTVTWTITVEALFYLLFPMLAKWAENARKFNLQVAFGVSLSLAALMPQLLTWVVGVTGSKAYYWFPPLWVPYFVIGVTLFHLSKRVQEAKTTGWARAAWAIAFVICLAVSSELFERALVQAMFVSVVCGLLVTLAQSTRGSEKQPHPVLIYLGKASFAIYLFQFWYVWLAQSLIKRFGHQDVLWHPATRIVLAIVVGCVMHSLLEERSRRWILGITKPVSEKKRMRYPVL